MLASLQCVCIICGERIHLSYQDQPLWVFTSVAGSLTSCFGEFCFNCVCGLLSCLSNSMTYLAFLCFLAYSETEWRYIFHKHCKPFGVYFSSFFFRLIFQFRFLNKSRCHWLIMFRIVKGRFWEHFQQHAWLKGSFSICIAWEDLVPPSCLKLSDGEMLC